MRESLPQGYLQAVVIVNAVEGGDLIARRLIAEIRNAQLNVGREVLCLAIDRIARASQLRIVGVVVCIHQIDSAGSDVPSL